MTSFVNDYLRYIVLIKKPSEVSVLQKAFLFVWLKRYVNASFLLR